MKSAWGVLSLLAALAVVALLAQRGLHAVGTTAGTGAGAAPSGQRAAQALEHAQTMREDVGRQLQEALQQREARSEPGQP